MKGLLLVGIGGFFGSAARYLVSNGMARWTLQNGFPYGTLSVNLAGCFVIGILAGGIERHQWLSADARLLLLTGVLGGFTTFSAFGLETVQLVRRGEWVFAAGNILLSVILGLLAVHAGMLLTGSKA